MNLTQLSNNLSEDFVIEGNHARISQRKVAELIGISQSSISRWLVRYAELAQTEAETITQRGFKGDALNEIVGYYATSKGISKKVKDNCVQLLIQSSKLGFQLLIDKMAGLQEILADSEPKELFKEYCEITDLIFEQVNIQPELIAGLKLNQAQKLLPKLASSLNENRQLLIQASATENQLMTATELGKKINISAQKVNQLLIDKGLQIKNEGRKSRKDPTFLPTDKGHEFCSFTLSTGSGNDSTSYQQLRWYESVLMVIN